MSEQTYDLLAVAKQLEIAMDLADQWRARAEEAAALAQRFSNQLDRLRVLYDELRARYEELDARHEAGVCADCGGK